MPILPARLPNPQLLWLLLPLAVAGLLCAPHVVFSGNPSEIRSSVDPWLLPADIRSGPGTSHKVERLPSPDVEPTPSSRRQPPAAMRLPPPEPEPISYGAVQRLPPATDPLLNPPAAGLAGPPEIIAPAAATTLAAWWQAPVSQPLRPAAAPWRVDLDTLLMIALQRSEHIRAISLEPLILETEIARQAAQFDPTAFLNSKWNDLNDPVGNTLTTGGPNRYLDNNWENTGGVRQKNLAGGQWQLAQDMGLRDTNSIFFVPANQANMRMMLTYSQPLMRGRGKFYNESVIVLAQTDTELARQELGRQLQDRLFLVAEVYWKLCLERSRLVQQRAAAATTEKLMQEMENRRDIDLLQNNILRARGAVAQRRAAVQRAELSVRNQESRLWALTSAVELGGQQPAELIPAAFPVSEALPLDPIGSVQEAIQFRPEVGASLQRIQAAQTRLSVSQHELMPMLNMVLEGYSRGLNGNFDVGQAFVNQFSQGRRATRPASSWKYHAATRRPKPASGGGSWSCGSLRWSSMRR